MAKDYDFQPDLDNSVDLDKLLLTQRQRFNLLRWALYGLLCIVGLLLQDTLLCRVNVQGGFVDLVPCLIFMITALQGAEQGSVFALIAAIFYDCAGTAPGMYTIPVITALAVLVAIFRQACLRRGFFSIALCAILSVFVYEMVVFAVGLFMGQALPERFGCMLMTAALTMLTVPVAYPFVRGIGKIGGETWKE